MDYLQHHGIRGQKWGKKNGPPYPIAPGDHSAAEKKHLMVEAGYFGDTSNKKKYSVKATYGEGKYTYYPKKSQAFKKAEKVDEERIRQVSRGNLTNKKEAEAFTSMLELIDIDRAKHQRILNSARDRNEKLQKNNKLSDQNMAKLGAQMSYHAMAREIDEATTRGILKRCTERGYTVESQEIRRFITTGKHALRDSALFTLGGVPLLFIPDSIQLDKRGNNSSGNIQYGRRYKVRP